MQGFHKTAFTFSLVLFGCFASYGSDTSVKTAAAVDPAVANGVKAYCLDFNWERHGFAAPGTWKDADPAAHVAWYKAAGANVIQTFAVSCNGYAWYKSEVVPEQPGLKHDFLREVVKRGHAEGMRVMGYFCIAANSRWGKENPEFSYGTPSAYHIPYTDAYLAYLTAAITDAVRTTGIDGFMIDWVWQPQRKANDNQWLEAEKALYQQLMGEPFPGEKALTKEQDTAYGRKAIDRCWKTIHAAAKQANPNIVIWLTVNNIKHPHIQGSQMLKEVDWVMGEAGKLDEILSMKSVIGERTQLITCMSDFGGPDAEKEVPKAMAAGLGIYGYAKPQHANGLIDLQSIFSRQMSELTGNDKRIAVLARAYRGKSLDAVWQDGQFVEPDRPLPFALQFRGRRGFSDTAVTNINGSRAVITITNPYQSGRGLITRRWQEWPAEIVIRLKRRSAAQPGPTHFRVANGTIGIGVTQIDGVSVFAGKMLGSLELKQSWRSEEFLNGGRPAEPITIADVKAHTDDEFVEITLPREIVAGNPEILCIEWSNGVETR